MPSRNIIKDNIPETYYHVYARGASKQVIFPTAEDYHHFIGLFARYLSNKPATSGTGQTYPCYTNEIELLAYCLMPNHFHLLVYQVDRNAMLKLMRCLMTSYSRYFNLKYKRTGSLFESRYKAARIESQVHLEHICRYIHLNPRYWKTYLYSSLKYHIEEESPEWLRPERITHLFDSSEDYLTFVEDYEEHRQMLSEIKHELANR